MSERQKHLDIRRTGEVAPTPIKLDRLLPERTWEVALGWISKWVSEGTGHDTFISTASAWKYLRPDTYKTRLQNHEGWDAVWAKAHTYIGKKPDAGQYIDLQSIDPEKLQTLLRTSTEWQTEMQEFQRTFSNKLYERENWSTQTLWQLLDHAYQLKLWGDTQSAEEFRVEFEKRVNKEEYAKHVLGSLVPRKPYNDQGYTTSICNLVALRECVPDFFEEYIRPSADWKQRLSTLEAEVADLPKNGPQEWAIRTTARLQKLVEIPNATEARYSLPQTRSY